jgi:SAM-dependent methyltransferase
LANVQHSTTGKLQKFLNRFERLHAGRGPIPFFDVPTSENSDPVGYLLANPDLAAPAQESSDPDFASHHFQNFGCNEHRQQLMTSALPQVAAMRKSKLAKLRKRSRRPLAALEVYSELFCGHKIEALKVPGDSRLPVPYERISCNLYDPAIDAWIDQNRTSLFLDAGAGFRNVYRPNVVNAEIAMFPSTDVLCFGDSLPFDDDTFDGVLSFAVLEHVEDPFRVTEELVRVVKPGGRIVVDWPFLHPFTATQITISTRRQKAQGSPLSALREPRLSSPSCR